MRTLTIAILLALFTMAALAAGCPRKPNQTNVDVNTATPADQTTTTADANGEAPKTDVDVNVKTGDTAATDQKEGDQTTSTDANGGDKSADQNASGDQSASGDKNASGDAGKTDEKPAEPAKEDPNVTTVVLETSKGNIEFAVHKDWAPIGAAHFLELINAGYYNGAPWFRVIPNFVAQCGIAADPKVTAQWQDKTIQDEPVKQGNKPGFVAFGKSGAPNSRSTHIFINFTDNSASLDPQGFSCFAEVTSGMDVAGKLKACEIQDQEGLSKEGIAMFKRMVPDGDTIIRAYVKEKK